MTSNNTPASVLSLKEDDIYPGTLEAIKTQPKVAIIGAGLSGICAGSQLIRKLGVRNFIIFEAKAGFGGTWADNVYPGAAVDIPTTFYSFSYEPSSNWIHNYSRQPELKLYAETVAAKYNLRPHLLTFTKVEKVAWDNATSTYTITTQDLRKHGLRKTWTFDFIICGVGQLNVPAMPDIPGLDSFAGDKWHSARWRDDVSLEGRKVLTIGNGATAAQFVPEVSKIAGEHKVFARSQNWMLKREEYLYSDLHRAAIKYIPGVRLFERFSIWFLADYVLWFAFQKKQWMIDLLQGEATKHLKNCVPGDDEKSKKLREMLTPDYSFGCRRVQFSNTFASTFLRPNTQMITDKIVRIEPKGVVTQAEGGAEVLHEGDVLLLGTGFQTHDFLGTLEVIDATGKRVEDKWKGLGAAEAYYGIMVADLPNFFMAYGPNTNLGHSSIIFMIECQVLFAIRAIAHVARRKKAALTLTTEGQAAFNAKLQDELSQLVWAGNCTSWYKTAAGKIENNWSGRVHRYSRETAAVNFDGKDFKLSGDLKWSTPKGTGSFFTSPIGLTLLAAGAAAGYFAATVLRK